MCRLPAGRRNPFRRTWPRAAACGPLFTPQGGNGVVPRRAVDHADAYGLRLQPCRGEPVARQTDLAFFRSTAHFHREDLSGREFRGSHMVRDPRDIVVSGYFYHLWTREKWARQVDGSLWGGVSYQEYLNSVDREQGLLAEIERAAGSTWPTWRRGTMSSPSSWNPRYEDVISNELPMFTRLFEFYGFNQKAVAVGLEAVEKLSIHTRAAAGEKKRHVRSGKTAQWRILWRRARRPFQGPHRRSPASFGL